MNYKSFSENVNALKEVIQKVPVGDSAVAVINGVQILGITALFIMIIRSYVMTTTAGRSVNWYNDIIKPLLIALILFNWITIMTGIDTISTMIGTALEKGANGSVSTQNIYTDFERDERNLSIYAKVEAAKKNIENDAKGFEFHDMIPGVDKLGIYIGEQMSYARVYLLTVFAELGMTIQNLVGILFFAYASVVLLILKITGGIAIVLAIIPSMQQSFTSWLKNFVAVHLWFAVAGLIFYVVDLIYLGTVDAMGLNISHLDMSSISSSIHTLKNKASKTDLFDEYIGMFRVKVWIFMAFGILKGILMFKVPNIVSMFVGSSQSSGGMFGAAFTPVSMAGKAAGGTAKTAGSFAGK